MPVLRTAQLLLWSVSYLKDLKARQSPGWWQLDFGVTFEACPSTHSSRGTHISYVQPHNSLCQSCLVQETPSPHLWLEKKISKYSK